MYQTYDNNYRSNHDYNNYRYYWNMDAASLNPSLNNLQLSQNNLYQTDINRSYDLNLDYPNHSNTNLFHNSYNGQVANNTSFNQLNRDFTNTLTRRPSYMLNHGPNKRHSNYEYAYNAFNSDRITYRNKNTLSRKANRNFKVYSEMNESESLNTTEIISSNDQINSYQYDVDDADSEYDNFEEYNRFVFLQLVFVKFDCYIFTQQNIFCNCDITKNVFVIC